MYNLLKECLNALNVLFLFPKCSPGTGLFVIQIGHANAENGWGPTCEYANVSTFLMLADWSIR